jgi:hypothetical protein
MPDAFEEQAVLVAAEQAAAEGDTIAAEGHLRTLLELQTARLGPEHAEVASTLHNLAVVCERAGRLSDAEGLYRRAFTVASAALPPQDSLVVRCRDDLSAFLEARLTPLQPSPDVAVPPPPAQPPARPASASGVRKPSPSAASRAPARPASRVRPPQPPSDRPSSRHYVVASAIVAVLVALIVAFVMRDREPAAPDPVAAAPVAAPAPKRAPAKKAAVPAATAPAPTAPGDSADVPPAAPVGATAQPTPAPTPPAEPATAPDPAPSAPAEASSDPGGIAVTDARLCRDLSTAGAWTCVPVDQPVPPGRLFFLTRIEVPATTQVVHQWSYGDEVVQSVSLRIQAAGRPGYRTYSRQTIDAARAGAWRVELRSADGRVLAEERFTVQ